MTTWVEKALVKATMTSLPAYSPSVDKRDTGERGRERGGVREREGEKGERGE